MLDVIFGGASTREEVEKCAGSSRSEMMDTLARLMEELGDKDEGEAAGDPLEQEEQEDSFDMMHCWPESMLRSKDCRPKVKQTVSKRTVRPVHRVY